MQQPMIYNGKYTGRFVWFFLTMKDLSLEMFKMVSMKSLVVVLLSLVTFLLVWLALHCHSSRHLV